MKRRGFLKLAAAPAEPNVHGASRYGFIHHEFGHHVTAVVVDLDGLTVFEPKFLRVDRVQARGRLIARHRDVDGIVGERRLHEPTLTARE